MPWKSLVGRTAKHGRTTNGVQAEGSQTAAARQTPVRKDRFWILVRRSLTNSRQTPAPVLPDFLRSETPMKARFLENTYQNAQQTDIRSSIARMSQVGLMAANPVLRRPVFQLGAASSLRILRPFMPRTSSPQISMARAMSTSSKFPTNSSLQQATRRQYGTVNGVPRNQLANMEANANKDPGNPNLQNGFYNLLLRANMPGIVVSR